jgi:hypothetical protein
MGSPAPFHAAGAATDPNFAPSSLVIALLELARSAAWSLSV